MWTFECKFCSLQVLVGLKNLSALHIHTHTHTHFSLNAYPERPEPINWEFYERNISVPNLVKEFKKQFEAVSVPYPKDTASAAIAQQQKEFVSES